jgi:dTDP-4-dehydrorhamnose reductase
MVPPGHPTVTLVKILVTGATGLVGSHVAGRLSLEHEVLALTHGHLDISHAAAVRRRVLETRPSLIINCAVVQVDESEQRPAKALAVNRDGAGFLAQAASEIGAEMIHFSTQYVFEGEPVGRAPYTIEDEACPVNHYGRTKVAGEEAVRSACGRSFIIRTSWVFGSGKQNFLCAAHKELRAGKRIRAIEDIWSSTTYVEDLIDQMLRVRDMGQYGTYHIVNHGVCTYYGFALEAGRLLGLTGDQLDPLIEVVKECDMSRSAARPRYTPMRCLLSERLGLPPMRDWRSALAAHITQDSREVIGTRQ